MGKHAIAAAILSLALTGCEAANLAITAMQGANLALDAAAGAKTQAEPANYGSYIGTCDLPNGQRIAVETVASCTDRKGQFLAGVRRPGR